MALDNSNDPFKLSNGIEISAADEREYRSIVLDNGLRVMLVSDPITDKASAAMDVNVGHLSDPEEFPGLAHFLEHMLFLGTEKYPNENSYNEFLNENGGSSNAYTSTESTNYYFDVTAPHLEGALDRFAQFFIAPLFTATATERELNAVHSENAKNLQNDFWRMFQLLKTTASPEHPFHKFGTGNLQTLKETPEAQGLDVRSALLAFHARYYSSNIMRLAVLGAESLDTLEGWARAKFSAVRNLNIPVPSSAFNGQPYTAEQLGRQYSIVPVKDLRVIKLIWPMRETRSLYQSKPHRYLSHLLGHEGAGSLLSLLKARGWANELTAGQSRSNVDFSMFQLGIEATDEGMSHIPDIIAAVFQFIQLMRQQPPTQWMWQECATQSSNSFRFRSKENPINYTTRLVSNMQLYPAEHAISGGSLFREWVPEQISELLGYLTPANMRVDVASKSFQGSTDQEEPWYGTQYSITPLSAEAQQQWASPPQIDPALALPTPNPFIATQFAIKPPQPVTACAPFPPTDAATAAAEGETKGTDAPPAPAPADAAPPAPAPDADADAPAQAPSLTSTPSTAKGAGAVPTRVVDNALGRLWFKQDDKFFQPKANVFLHLDSPAARLTPAHDVCAELYTRLVKDALTEFAYDAECAGLSYDVKRARGGIQFTCCGFDHKLPLLLRAVLERFATLELKEARFQLLREKLSKEYHNFSKEQPYQHTIYNGTYLLSTMAHHIEEKKTAIASLSLAHMAAFQTQLLASVHTQAFIHGNMTCDEAVSLYTALRAILSPTPLPPSQQCAPRSACLPQAGIRLIHRQQCEDEDNVNSAIELFFQVGLSHPQLSSRVDLLVHLLREPAFNILRTQEQLGYLVFTGVRSVYGVEGIRSIIQSQQRDPAYLLSRIEAFLVSFRDILITMSEADWAANVAAVVARKLEKDKTLWKESHRLWMEMPNGLYVFNRHERDAAIISTLSQADIVTFFDAFLRRGGASRRSVALMEYGRNHPLPTAAAGSAEEEEKEATEPEEGTDKAGAQGADNTTDKAEEEGSDKAEKGSDKKTGADSKGEGAADKADTTAEEPSSASDSGGGDNDSPATAKAEGGEGEDAQKAEAEAAAAAAKKAEAEAEAKAAALAAALERFPLPPSDVEEDTAEVSDLLRLKLSLSLYPVAQYAQREAAAAVAQARL